MYIKVVHHQYDTVNMYEATKLSYQRGDHLTLEIDGSSMWFNEMDPVTVYVMSSEGRTIDKITWDPISESMA